MKTIKSKITINRGKARLWLEGKYLATEGFSYHTPYDLFIEGNMVYLIACADGSRKVSGRKRKGAVEWTPIIDICCEEMTKLFAGCTHLNVSIDKGVIMCEKFNDSPLMMAA